MNSTFLTLNWKDVLKGFLVAVITALLTASYNAINAGGVNLTWDFWKPTLLAALGGGIAYLIKNVLTNSNGEILKKE